MARELWGNPHAAIGKRIRVTLKDDWREVIGVVTDMRDNGVDQPPPTTVYWPLLLNKFESENELAIHNIVYLIRSPRAGSSAFVRELQAAVNSVAPTLPVAQVKTLDAVYQESLSRTFFTLLLLTIAGGMALLLGIVGIYAVISYSVAQRTREVGIRLALGASIKEIVHAFLREGLLMCALGTTFGFAAALLGTRLMKSLLYQISPTDPVTYLLTMVALLVAAAAGSYLPARRAARVDPAETLRAQ
jgi:predicted lysophospholipase L1 biosynthesis ABC-type transport system permease subunit